MIFFLSSFPYYNERKEVRQSALPPSNIGRIPHYEQPINTTTIYMLIRVTFFLLVPAEISCFHDYGQELASNLINFVILKLEEIIAKSDGSKEIFTKKKNNC